ncbi:AAA family ATPase [Candidatus Gracilibacteria bacterium]|nr:AAA family ATPase [Candidatus Gracilibacteria bacterium]MCF7819313.1 AAA family ATPase [Candidatus Gracilibacteria bacterium]
MKQFLFSAAACRAIDLVEEGKQNVFITGKAGTGKSTLLEHLRLHSKRKMVVLAPTGVAAINVNGDTIHSFFGLKPGFELDEAREKRVNEKKAKRYQSLKTILIDEISMVRADLLDAIDIFLKKVRDNFEPFGGVQMVFFGDLYQLPPVMTSADKDKFLSEYDSPYFFDAKVFQGAHDLLSEKFHLEFIELDEIYRQTDMDFIDVLNSVRNNCVTDDHLSMLNARHDGDFIPSEDDNYIHLVTTNADASAINTHKLRQLESREVTFHSTTTGKIARNLRPNEEEITLCVGAQIMFIYNDPERRWVNGTIGKVVDICEGYNEEIEEDETFLIIEKTDGARVEVRPYKWEISRYVFDGGEFKREQIGSFTQIPLKLAWAITIHKSQGKTFEKVIIDLGRGSFAHGQTYVALSRCTSLEGIVLRRPFRRSDVIMDRRVEGFGR